MDVTPRPTAPGSNRSRAIEAALATVRATHAPTGQLRRDKPPIPPGGPRKRSITEGPQGAPRKLRKFFFFDTCGFSLGTVAIKASVDPRTGRHSFAWNYLATSRVSPTLYMAHVDIDDDGQPKAWEWGADSDTNDWLIAGTNLTFDLSEQPAVYSPVAYGRLGNHRIGSHGLGFGVHAPNATDVRVVIRTASGAEDVFQLHRDRDGEWTGILDASVGVEDAYARYVGRPYVYELLTTVGEWVRRPDPRQLAFERRWLAPDVVRVDARTGTQTDRFAPWLVTFKELVVAPVPQDARAAFLGVVDEAGKPLTRAELVARLGVFDDDALFAQMIRDRDEIVDAIHEHRLHHLSDARHTKQELRATLGDGAAAALRRHMEVHWPAQLALDHIEEDDAGHARIRLARRGQTFSILVPSYEQLSGCTLLPYVYIEDEHGRRALLDSRRFGEPRPDTGRDLGVRWSVIGELDYERTNSHAQLPTRPADVVIKQLHVASFGTPRDVEAALPYLKEHCNAILLTPTSVQDGRRGNGYNGDWTLAQEGGYWDVDEDRWVHGTEAIARLVDAAGSQGILVGYDFVVGHHIFTPLRNYDGPEDMYYAHDGLVLHGPHGDALAYGAPAARQLLLDIKAHALARLGFQFVRNDAPAALTEGDDYETDVATETGAIYRGRYRGAGEAGRQLYRGLSRISDMAGNPLFEITEALPPRVQLSRSTSAGGFGPQRALVHMVSREAGYVLVHDQGKDHRGPKVAIIDGQTRGVHPTRRLDELLRSVVRPDNYVLEPFLVQHLIDSLDQRREAGGPPVRVAMKNRGPQLPDQRARSLHRFVHAFGMAAPGIPSTFQNSESLALRDDPEHRFETNQWDCDRTFGADRGWQALLAYEWADIDASDHGIARMLELSKQPVAVRHADPRHAQLCDSGRRLVHDLSVAADPSKVIRWIMQRANAAHEQELFRLRLAHRSFRVDRPATELFPPHEHGGVIAFYRAYNRERLTCIGNISVITHHGWPVPLPGRSQVLFNTEDARFGGSHHGPRVGTELVPDLRGEARVDLPAGGWVLILSS